VEKLWAARFQRHHQSRSRRQISNSALESDDGRATIDGKPVVDNGGVHGMDKKSGSIELTAGNHDLSAGIPQQRREVEVGLASCSGNNQTARRRGAEGEVLFHDPAKMKAIS
jgi:hypothetical protein